MNLVKVRMQGMSWTTAKEYITYASSYLSSQRLTKVNVTSHKTMQWYLKPSVINHKGVSKPEMKYSNINILLAHKYKKFMYKAAHM